ncbi:hypothetical protein ACT3CD_13250 [Geofilum sp. OHC36d9]|uniref:hypothetical protein n=1 Tax=Geofilum sp. OHC36d9 TaxID=3458413 RepID=UPI004034B836
MKIIQRKPIISNAIMILIGIINFFVIVSIMTDNWISWRTTFWVELPLLLFYLFVVYLIFKASIGFWEKSKTKLILSTVLLLSNLIILLLNVYCWVDLYDGKTNALLP